MRLDRKAIEQQARGWWLSLQPSKDGRYPGDRAALARLRRASHTVEAAAEPATLDLYGRLALLPKDARESQIAEALGRVAVLAAVLAHVTDDTRVLLGRALGPTQAKAPESAVLKPLRLARLLAARGDADIHTAFRRAIALLGGTANVGELAWLVLVWDHPDMGDRVRTLFAFAYHDASAHAPAESHETETTDPSVGATPST